MLYATECNFLPHRFRIVNSKSLDHHPLGPDLTSSAVSHSKVRNKTADDRS